MNAKTILLSDIPDGARWDQQLLKAMLAKGKGFYHHTPLVFAFKTKQLLN